MKDSHYSVAIRTLGTAGAKYQQELYSLQAQSIKPQHIYVYIAEGYPLPKETIGEEEYIRCSKGMVAQRALPYNEIESDWILMLDDDVFLPPNAVEIMINEAYSLNLDCIAADSFHNQDMKCWQKIMAILKSWTTPRFDDGWAFKIGLSGSFSYNNNPKCGCYLSQTAAGPCSLWKKASFQRVRFCDEIWLDSFGFSAGDDMLLFYKLYINGGRLGISYDCGAVHLDAMSSRNILYNNSSKKFYMRAKTMLIIWYRTQVESVNNRARKKVLAYCMFALKLLWLFLIHCVLSVISLKLTTIVQFVKGNADAVRFIYSNEYKLNVPNYFIDESSTRN